MSNLEQMHPRKEYHSGTGFALFSDVQQQLLEALRTKPLLPVNEAQAAEMLQIDISYAFAAANPAEAALYLAMRSASAYIPRRDREVDDFLTRHGVTEHETAEANRYTFAGGFDDMRFPWYFTAALANQAVNACIEQGTLTSEQKAQFSLGDWAGIISTGWFGRLVHSMAYAPVGTYGTYGRSFISYRAGSLAQRLHANDHLPLGVPLFVQEERLEPEDGYIYATVSLGRTAVRGLRQAMQVTGDSAGCPAARYAARLHADSLQHDNHVHNMVANGALRIEPSHADANHFRATQDYSAIETTLLFFAQQLDTYNERYGTPRFSFAHGEPRVMHERIPVLDVLRRPAY